MQRIIKKLQCEAQYIDKQNISSIPSRLGCHLQTVAIAMPDKPRNRTNANLIHVGGSVIGFFGLYDHCILFTCHSQRQITHV